MLRPEKPAVRIVEPLAGNVIRFPDQKKQVRRGRWKGRLSRAIPDAKTVLVGGIAWGVLKTLSALVGAFQHSRLIIASPLAVFLLFFVGGGAAFAPALFVGEVVFGKSGRGVRFIGGSFLIFLATHLVTAAIFAIQYQMFYSAWHAPFPDKVWFFQLAFTSASAVYQFTVDAMMIFLPATPVAFAAYGLWFARRAH
jgi:hypothetical protein